MVLSAGKRKTVATRVFGESVFNELDTSLSYTPSPGKPPSKSTRAATDAVNTNTITRIDEGENEDSQSPEPTILFETKPSQAKKVNDDPLGNKRVSFADDKENMDGVNWTSLDHSNVSVSMQSFRAAELSRLRASNKSPVRRVLVKRTAAAIDDATTSIKSSLKQFSKHSTSKPGSNIVSVNQSLNATRKAKTEVVRDKSKAAKSVRFQWDQENSEAKSLQHKVEVNRRQIRTIQRQLSSAHFREKARKEEAEKMERFAKLEQEYVFNSEVFRDHHQQLKKEKDENRRKSIDARSKIRRNKREGEERLRMKKLEEEQANFEVKTDLHRARIEAARANAESRRKSFQFRAGDARRIRGMRAVWREKEYREMHKSFELKRAAARDVENYKKQVLKEERDDKKARNFDARQVRKREEEQAHDAMIAEHMSYELKWAGERDAEAYKKRMREERRKSLAGRNKESVRHAKVMEELRCLAREKETESFMLKWAGEEDAKAYLAKLAEERRKSLQLDAKDACKARQWEEELHSKEVQEAIANGILQSECQKDIEKYKAECEERRRKSLQYRGKQTQLQRLESEKRRLEQMQKDEESFKLETLARKDVEDYYKDCQRRRRKSLALRAKEKRQHTEWKRRMEEKGHQERAYTSYLNSLDIQHMALAKEQERARMAMDALRSAGCKLKGNPFNDLLNDI